MKDLNNLDIVTIGLIADAKVWGEIIGRLSGWIHIKATDRWNNEYVNAYGISPTPTPTIYLIDKEHKIRHKIKNLEELKESIITG